MRILILDDRRDDAELLVRELGRGGRSVEWRHATNQAEYLELLDWPPDVILADYSMPGFSAPDALDLLTVRDVDIPFIVISGSIGEETATAILKKGAADYLLKDRLTRVNVAIERALHERQQRRATRDAERRLREAEERTRFALEASRVGVWEADLRTGAARWSDVLEGLHGMSPGSFGGTFRDFVEQIHPEDRQAAAEAIERATRDRTDSSILYRSIWPDGSVHWIRGRGRTFYDERGQPIRAAGVGMEVTELRQLEQQYRQAQKMEAVGQLAGGVAHDFNNLLTVIQGFCQVILERPEAHPDEFELQQILQAADRATSLTRQLLAFSRRQILETTTFDLRDTLDKLIPMLRRLIGENIQIFVTAPDDVCAVRADASQIEQVVLNLAVNARDAMPGAGKLVFEIAAVTLDESYTRGRPDASPGEYVLLAISDTGSGIDPTIIEHIFEPFFTTKGKEKGTGLGLSTVYGIVKQSGGHVTVYSERGRGTTFKVYLPQATGTAVTGDGLPVARAHAPSGSETILVVEDDEAVRLLIAEILKRRGYRALIAPTPGEALSLFANEPEIDLLLTDVVLPEMNGRELAERLTRQRPGLRVLYMSGYTDTAIVHQGNLESGMRFVSKPFSPDTLSRKLREVLTAAN